MPTACELAGVKPADNIQGVSYVAAMTGKGEQKAHPYLYWEFHEAGGRIAVRQGKWKLVRYNVKKGKPKPWNF